MLLQSAHFSHRLKFLIFIFGFYVKKTRILAKQKKMKVWLNMNRGGSNWTDLQYTISSGEVVDVFEWANLLSGKEINIFQLQINHYLFSVGITVYMKKGIQVEMNKKCRQIGWNIFTLFYECIISRL